jgi:hypothetical protein
MKTLKTLFEDNLTQLRTNIQRGFPNTRARQHRVGMVNVISTQFIAYPQQFSFLVEAKVRGEDGITYDSNMLFKDVEFQEADSPNVVTFKANNGEEYHIIPVVRNLHGVELNCTCLDYMWRFWQQNYQKDVQFGKGPNPYIRKTPPPPEGYPYANPEQVTGMCKHLIKLSDNLQQKGILKT